MSSSKQTLSFRKRHPVLFVLALIGIVFAAGVIPLTAEACGYNGSYVLFALACVAGIIKVVTGKNNTEQTDTVPSE